MNISSIFPAYEAYENDSEGYRKIIEADDALVGVKYGQLDIYTNKLIKGKVSETITGDVTRKTTGEVSEEIDGNFTEKFTKDVTTTINGNLTETINGETKTITEWSYLFNKKTIDEIDINMNDIYINHEDE